MTYMTIIHWLVLLIIFLLMILAVFLIIRKYPEEKTFAYQLSSVVVLIYLVLMAGSIFLLDQSLKSAELLNFKNQRVLRNETMVLTGKVKNTGKFTIGTVTLYLRMSNGALAYKTLRGKDVYNPSGGSLFSGGGDDKDIKITTLEKEFEILENLKPGRTKSFRVTFKYPAHFTRPSLKTELYIH